MCLCVSTPVLRSSFPHNVRGENRTHAPRNCGWYRAIVCHDGSVGVCGHPTVELYGKQREGIALQHAHTRSHTHIHRHHKLVLHTNTRLVVCVCRGDARCAWILPQPVLVSSAPSSTPSQSQSSSLQHSTMGAHTRLRARWRPASPCSRRIIALID